MSTILTTKNIGKQDQRGVIAALREAAGKISGAEYRHERIRKNKTRAEDNLHTLVRDGKPVITLRTSTGTARWVKGLR